MQYKKNHIIIAVLALILVSSGAFYGGMTYQKSQNPQQAGKGGFSRGMGQDNRSGGQPGSGRTGGGPGGMMQGGFVSGEILSKDDKSVTIKTRDGGSKIVYFSDTTVVGKSVTGATADLSVGEQVMASGKANADGSVVADNIQIRPGEPNQNQNQNK